jgi:outer membrane protein insertion porin family
LRRRLLLTILALLTAVAAVSSQEPEISFKKVAVFPFAVLSKTPMEHLGEKVRQEFEERLKGEGFTMVSQMDLVKALQALKEPLNDTLAKEIARKLGADALIWGQVVIIGDAVTLEARLLDLTGKLAPTSLKLTGTGLGALTGLSRQMAGEAALRIMGKERVQRIEVKGNRRIEKDAIMGVMQTREGDLLSPLRLQQDLKAIYKMGYFTDVKFELTDTPQGRILVVVVEEKPAIRSVTVQGNRKIKKDKLLEAMAIKSLTVASEAVIKEAVEKGLKEYREKGYYNARITYRLEPVTPNEVNLVFTVDEGGKILVKEIKFEGNANVKSSEIKKVMETKEKSFVPFLSYFTGRGKLVQDTLERDVEKITALYFNKGYIKAKVGEPKVEIRDGGIYISIAITEGPVYTVGRVDFQGDILDDKEKLREKLQITKSKVFSREVIQKDIAELSDYYANFGYANADVTPLLKENEETRTVDVTYDISQGKKVRFERIEIVGNVKTRDKVIRRELRVYEQELFNAAKLKESMRNLRRLEYFEDVNFSTSVGSAPDRMNLKITVKERPTGTFGVGIGYSTQDKLVGMVEISQSNLFGRGQQLRVQGIVGSIAQRYRLSFTEPYLFDRPLGFGFDVYNWERAYTEYVRRSIGGDARLSHPLKWQYVRLFGSYRFENVNLTELTRYASPILKEAATIHNTSALLVGVRRDSRDAIFTTTKGSDNSISVEWAGLGGDVAYMRYIADSAWYFPLFWGTVGVVHGRAGYIQGLSYGKLPAYELFYLGGIDSIRGFKYAEISPRDPRTGERVGGNRFFQVNLEYRFPIPKLKEFGITGVTFFDCGNVYSGLSNVYVPPVRTSVGAGVRWLSPMGPLRVEWGYNLDKRQYERQSAWEFTMGGSF